VQEPHPSRRRDKQLQLSDSGFFRSVHEFENGWLLGLSPIGQAATSRPRDLVFCEGEQLFWGAKDEARSTRTLARASELYPETLRRFPGDFTFLQFLDDGSLILVRSCAGRVPLYYARQGSGFLVGSRLDYLVAFSSGAARLDGLSMGLALSGYATFPNGRSPIAGVQCLAPAHRLRLSVGSNPEPIRYWSPRRALQRPSPRRAQEHADQLHQLLLAELTRETAANGGNLLWWSGGVDSSALAALISDQVKTPLWTQTFTSPDEETARFEDAYLLPLLERCRFARSWRETKTPERYLELAKEGPRLSYPVSYFPLSALSKVRQQAPIAVAMGGELADEGTGSHRNIGDWLDHAHALDVMHLGGSSPTGFRTAQQWLSWRAKRPFRKQWLRLPETLGADIQEEVADEYRAWQFEQRRRFAQDEGPLRSLWFRIGQDAWRAEWWEATTSLGVRPLAPFCTRELLELYFDCHPLEWFEGRRPKALLRRAMQGKMPDWHRERPDKGIWPGYLAGTLLPAHKPKSDLAHDLLSAQWLRTTFDGPENQTVQLPALDALRLQWLENMLHAVDTLCTTHKALRREQILESAISIESQRHSPSSAVTP